MRKGERAREKETEIENHWGLLESTSANDIASREEPSPGWILHVNHSCSKLSCCFCNSHREFIDSWLPAHGLGNAHHGCFVTEARGGAEQRALSWINPWLTSHIVHLHVQGKKTQDSGGEGAELLVLSRIWEALLRVAEMKRESGRREISNFFKGQKSHENVERWQNQRERRFDHFITQLPDLWKRSVTLLSPKPALIVVLFYGLFFYF